MVLFRSLLTSTSRSSGGGGWLGLGLCFPLGSGNHRGKVVPKKASVIWRIFVSSSPSESRLMFWASPVSSYIPCVCVWEGGGGNLE